MYFVFSSYFHFFEMYSLCECTLAHHCYDKFLATTSMMLIHLLKSLVNAWKWGNRIRPVNAAAATKFSIPVLYVNSLQSPKMSMALRNQCHVYVHEFTNPLTAIQNALHFPFTFFAIDWFRGRYLMCLQMMLQRVFLFYLFLWMWYTERWAKENVPT